MDDVDLGTTMADHYRSHALEGVKVRLRSEAERPPSTGICQECGEDIETARLTAVPTTPLCGDCAALEEEAKKRQSRCGPAYGQRNYR